MVVVVVAIAQIAKLGCEKLWVQNQIVKITERGDVFVSQTVLQQEVCHVSPIIYRCGRRTLCNPGHRVEEKIGTLPVLLMQCHSDLTGRQTTAFDSRHVLGSRCCTLRALRGGLRNVRQSRLFWPVNLPSCTAHMPRGLLAGQWPC